MDVTLDAGQTPVFPPLCVACGNPHVTHKALFNAHEGFNKYGPEIWRRVPCCFRCACRVHLIRVGRALVVATAILALMGIGFSALPGFPHAVGVAGAITLAVDILAFVFIFARVHPPFDLDLVNGLATYRFDNDEVAHRFRDANPSPRRRAHR